MTNKAHCLSILSSMKADCELAMALVDTLLEEQAALIKTQTSALESITAKKEAQMFELEQHMSACVEAAKRDGFEATTQGLISWIDSLAPAAPALPRTYATLRGTLAQAKRLNEVNGEIVTEQLASIKDRLSILTAASTMQSNNASNTYGPASGFSGKEGVSRPRAVVR